MAVIPRRNEKQRLCKIWEGGGGANKVHYGKCGDQCLGLSTSCTSFSKMFPVISHKVAQKSLKNQSKVTFGNEGCSRVVRIKKNYFWPDAKICKLYYKCKISKHFLCNFAA